jgi:hypothetical protein
MVEAIELLDNLNNGTLSLLSLNLTDLSFIENHKHKDKITELYCSYKQLSSIPNLPNLAILSCSEK